MRLCFSSLPLFCTPQRYIHKEFSTSYPNMPHLPHAPPCLHGNLSSPRPDPRPQAGLSAATPLSSSARSAFHPPSAANTSRWHPRQREREREAAATARLARQWPQRRPSDDDIKAEPEDACCRCRRPPVPAVGTFASPPSSR